jgi:hypothetical protein
MKHTIKYPTPPGYGDVVATYTDECAGAVTSLTWMGREFIDSVDHGRLLQSAFSTNTANSESYNPTEGGRALDGYSTGPSSSKLWCNTNRGNSFSTVNRMAFWNGPHKLSNYMFTKTLTLGYTGIWNAIEWKGTFYIPENEKPAVGQFEILTGYMPKVFSTFQTVDPATGALSPLSDGPGEQPHPIIFSTPDGASAMGVWVPKGTPGGGYGRWRFADCVKWNAVSRVSNPIGANTFRVLMAYGSRGDVVQTLKGLYARGGV